MGIAELPAPEAPIEAAAFAFRGATDLLLSSIAISLKRIADNSDATRALLEAQVKNSDEIARQLRGGALDKLREESPL